jgi:hypothetical protein
LVWDLAIKNRTFQIIQKILDEKLLGSYLVTFCVQWSRSCSLGPSNKEDDTEDSFSKLWCKHRLGNSVIKKFPDIKVERFVVECGKDT